MIIEFKRVEDPIGTEIFARDLCAEDIAIVINTCNDAWKCKRKDIILLGKTTRFSTITGTVHINIKCNLLDGKTRFVKDVVQISIIRHPQFASCSTTWFKDYNDVE